ncbi:MAG: hypothetical protein ACI37S_07115 [Candidatus Gastranaerophilaceae bacterium]
MMINPIQAYGMAPMYTIRIDMVPMTMPQQVNQGQNKQVNEVMPQPVVYSIPQVSVFEKEKIESKNTEVKKAEVENVQEKQIENKNVEKKQVEDKKQETTVAQALAAQAMVQPAQTTQAQVAEAAPKKDIEEPKKVVNKRPEIVKPEEMKTAIDIDGLLSILNSPDYEDQADAMEAISEVVKYAPDRAGELFDKKVVDSLQDIANKDTSKLDAKEKASADRNKEYAMFTIASLQKYYSDEVQSMTNQTVPVKELFGMKTIINGLKNASASIREAAVAALGHIKKPEYKLELGNIFKSAKQDSAQNVQKQADKQLQAMA